MTAGILFNNARGEASTLQMAPPFSFSDVKMTVFPLQANLARLTQFCDAYLNQADNLVQFKPFLPFVYLIILDYGRMSAPATQTGWVSQREVAFGVPLRWLEPDQTGAMCFKDFAFTTPFIFVDNELSLSTGREVYGWPKLLARLDPTVDEWIKDPHGARRVFEIRSRAAADHDGDDLKAPFLSVTQTPLTGLMDFPPNLKSATQAAAAWPEALVAMARAMRDAGSALGEIVAERARRAKGIGDLVNLDVLRRLLSVDDPAMFLSPRKWADIGGLLRGIFPELYSNTINLKQFRDAENPMETCYQAITAAKMPIVRVGGAGFLGTQNLMMGQLDGGYRVNIINTSTVPVVSHLGLVEAGHHEVEGGLLSSFSPVCPFWLRIDMVYDLGDTLFMRTRSGDWRRVPDGSVETAPIPVPRPKLFMQPAAKAASGLGGIGRETDDVAGISAATDPEETHLARDYYLIEASNPFNTTRGASEALGGVFRFKDARVRVLPLLADPEILARFVDNYIQVPGQMRVAPWGRHVYLLSTQYESITSDLSPGRKGSACELTFAVPVKCYDDDANPEPPKAPFTGSDRDADPRRQRGATQLIGTAIVTPFNYVDNITSAITESEVFGVPTLRSEIVSPPEGWSARSDQKGILLEARAIVIPSLGTSSEGTRKTLVEIRNTPMFADEDTDSWRRISSHWGSMLAADLLFKSKESGQLDQDDGWSPDFEWARAMALRILGGLHGVNTLSLKQFRDASRPENACYQGVVTRGMSIDKLHSLEEIDGNLTVSITRYPTQPIAGTLGLIPKRTVVKDDGVCDEFEPIRPFELRADLISSQGRTLFERAESEEWGLINLPEGPLGWRPASEQDVELARASADKGEPRPKISYVRYDAATATRGRLKPLVLDNAEHKAFLDDARAMNVRDPLLLWRGVELGSLHHSDILRAMDENRVDDIQSFVRSRPPESGRAGETAGTWINRVYELAGALEFVTPATVLDSMLSRGWGSRKARKSLFRIETQDFRVRRSTLGPVLAEQLFPTRESQDGYWPQSKEFAFETNLLSAMTESSLPEEFSKFLSVTAEFEEGLEDARDIAKKTLPAWFFQSAFEHKPVVDQIFAMDPDPDRIGEQSDDTADHENDALLKHVEQLKNVASRMGVWPGRYKRELRDGIVAFFDEIYRRRKAAGGDYTDLRFFGRSWVRMMDRMVAEAIPDGFAESDDLNLSYLLASQNLKYEPPPPGWLKARLEMLAANQPQSAEKLLERAAEWREEMLAKWTG